MKKLILTILTMGAVMISAVNATTLADNIDVSAGVSTTNFTTDRGLATREDSFGYSLSLGAPLSDGTLSFGVGLNDVDGDFEQDFAITYGREISVFGQTLGAVLGFAGTDSSFGDREEISAGFTYGTTFGDVTTTVWNELENDWFGVEIGISRDIASPIADLTLTPFVTANLAEEYKAIEAGLKAGYIVSDQLSLSAKLSYNNNDFEGSSFEVDNEWIVGAGLNFKF
jgi:hypothetical protein|tara:strand:- start:17 stop:697 length:681 start_codon:yes stop_codon:yes gene_type:complete